MGKVGFQSYTKFKNGIKELKQIYDVTYHLYLEYNEELEEKIKEVDKKETLTTSLEITNHSPVALYQYTQKAYPEKFRQLVLINLVTNLEVFLTDLVEEISSRTLSPFYSDEKIEYHKSHLLSLGDISRIEKSLINKETRNLTNGGLEDINKYYQNRFDIDFGSLGVNYKKVKEIHERRHLHVHRNGYCDNKYAQRYPSYNFSPGEKINLTNDYIIDSLEIISEFAGSVNTSCLNKYPKKERERISIKGDKTETKENEIKLFIKLTSLNSKLNIQHILNQKVYNKNPLKDYLLQIYQEDKILYLFISAEGRVIDKIMGKVKNLQNAKFNYATDLKFLE